MSIRKRKWTTTKGEKKEAWIVDYVDQDGDRHIRTFEKKRDADAYHATVNVDVRQGVHSGITLARAAEDWLSHVAREGRERSTMAQYGQHAHRHIIPRIGDLKLAHLTTVRISAFRDDLLADLSRPLAKKVLTSLKSILREAQRRGNVAQNVADGVSVGLDKRA